MKSSTNIIDKVFDTSLGGLPVFFWVVMFPLALMLFIAMKLNELRYVKKVINVIGKISLIFITMMGIVTILVFIPQWYPIIKENVLLFFLYSIFSILGIYRVITHNHFFE